MVKGVMKALLRSMGESKLSFNELNTVNLKVSNLVNERPIGIRPKSRSDCDCLHTVSSDHPRGIQPDLLSLALLKILIASPAYSAIDATWCKRSTLSFG